MTFEEPWLFEQRLAFGVELFRTESDYQSTDYNELRTGFEFFNFMPKPGESRDVLVQRFDL